MVNDTDQILITCGACSAQFSETLGWLKAHPTDTFRCPKCAAGIKYDRVELVGLTNQQPSDKPGRITLHPIDNSD